MRVRWVGTVVALSLTLVLGFGCADGDETPAAEDVAEVEPDIVTPPDDATSGEPDAWTSSFEPGVEMRDGIRILRLKGTAYEMGRQHAELLEPELLQGIDYIENSELGLLETFARGLGFLAEAREQSYESILEECRGMADVLGDDGWTFDRCLALAYGEVVLEFVAGGLLQCTQFAVAGAATRDGELLHGRNLDWDYIDYLLTYPTIIVRHPEGRIPFAVVGFPGCVAPYTGMNAAGISVASNEAHARSSADVKREGRPHTQMQYEILAMATSFAEARAFVEAQEHMTVEGIMVADGDRREAGAFEMTGYNMAVRTLDEHGVTYLTNHFIDPTMIPHHKELPETASSKSRLARVLELVPPGNPASLHGTFDVEAAIQVLRDSYNPVTAEEAPADLFDGAGTIANNGCIHSVVFQPGARTFYVAAGEPHVPSRTFVGFTMEELLHPGGAGAEPPNYP